MPTIIQIPGTSPPDLRDIVGLDPAVLQTCTLSDLLFVMQEVGVSTDGIADKAAAAARLFERAAIAL